VDQLLEDAASVREPRASEASVVPELLKTRSVRLVANDEWRCIDDQERLNGEKLGKPREKFYSTQAMLDALEGPQS
jgi:hypothetical protein